jgi:phosphatidylserine/phosphatidylglycerophosphate/cardiolipin synthase-like enzyme
VAFCPGETAEALILQSLLSAKKSVDVAMFQFTNEKMVQALCFLSAESQLPVRVFVGPELSSPALVNILHQLARSGVQIFITRIPNGKLHLKCAVIDDNIVLTGAANWTRQAFDTNIEDVLCIDSSELAARYRQRLNELLINDGPWTEHGSEIYPRTTRPESPPLSATGVFHCPVKQAAVFFSPANEGAAILREQILSATSRVDVAMYLLTYPPLCDALREKAAQSNVAIRILVDSEMLASPDILRSLASAGASVFWWGRKQSLLHLKAAVIDHHSVWTGSANWDASAFTLNIEDLLWLESPQLATTYLRFFDWIEQQPDIQPFQVLEPAAVPLTPPETVLKPGEYFTGLPPTGPRTNWTIIRKPFPAFQTTASVQYLADEAYFPVLLNLVNNARQSILISMYVMPAGPGRLRPPADRASRSPCQCR